MGCEPTGDCKSHGEEMPFVRYSPGYKLLGDVTIEEGSICFYCLLDQVDRKIRAIERRSHG